MPRLQQDTPLPSAYLGIDPGVSGGLALITPPGETTTAPMPKTRRDLWDLLATFSTQFERILAVVEKVGGYVDRGEGEKRTGEGEKGGGAANGAAMFKFGVSYGEICMALTALGISYEEIPAATWQRAVGLSPRKRGSGRGKKEIRSQFKNRLKAAAQALYPDLHITLATSDALLIATYCQRKHEGRLGR